MTISRTVYNQLFEHSDSASTEHVIRLRPTEAKAGAVVVSAKNKIQMWTQEEHERFLVALEMFPAGPWKKVADYIGTKTPRQTMTHAQKYRQKISRRQRGLRNQKKATTSAPNSPKHHLHTHQPSAIDTQTDFAHAPHPTQSPYGVADVYVKNEDNVAAFQQQQADGRLDMLARAMQLQTDAKPSAFAQQQPPTPPQDGSFIAPARSLSPVPVPASPSAPSSPGNSSLPSLAQILNLRGSAAGTNGTTATAPTRPGCNCNCSCSPSSSTKAQTGCHPSPPRP